MIPALSSGGKTMGESGMISDDQNRSAPKHSRTFGKKNRLIKTKDFRKVYRCGRSYKSDFIVLRLLSTATGTNRIGFSISARSIKRAFRRNRLKRLFREAYRRHKECFKTGFDMVLVMKRDTKDSFSLQDAEKMLLSLGRQSGILV